MCEIENSKHGYREAARGTAFTVPAAKANEWGRLLHGHYLTLRKTPAGRDAITAMMSDEDANVRLWAASHVLEWAPDAGQVVLEELSNSAGLLGFTAEMTLKEYKKGRLMFGPAAGGKTDDGEEENSD